MKRTFMNSKSRIKDFVRPYYYIIIDLFDRNKKLTLKNSTLKDKYEGKRVFFILSGESVTHIDFLSLKNEYTFGYSFLFFHKDIVNLPLNFFLATGMIKKYDKLSSLQDPNWPEKFLPSSERSKLYIFFENVKEKFTNNGVITFVDSYNFEYLKKRGLFDVHKGNIFCIKRLRNLPTTKNVKLDLTKRFISGRGGAAIAPLIMMYMGFKKIYLCGAGYSYKPTYEFHYYDNYVFPKSIGKEKAIIEARKVVGPHNEKRDTNIEYHGLFEKDDFYRGIYIRNIPDDSSTMNEHRILNEFAKSQGVRIINIVPDGFESPIYEKITWEEVVDNVLPNPPKLT